MPSLQPLTIWVLLTNGKPHAPAVRSWSIEKPSQEEHDMAAMEGEKWAAFVPALAAQQPEALARQERVPLTDEQRKQITAMWSRENRNYTVADVIDAVEAAHGIRAARSSEGGQP